MKEAKVIELFAGVGGFRVGFNESNRKSGTEFFKTVWANQWEPATPDKQHAAWVYRKQFGDKGFSNEDITTVPVSRIPNHDILVGGFPCQDYSVARGKNLSSGIEGKKGVLWWSIDKILREKENNRPQVLLLENVDRLINSPSKARGRDFAIILECLNSNGYIAEWRIINAAEYGMPQKRRRTYILAYRKDKKIGRSIKNPIDWLISDGVFATAFPIQEVNRANVEKVILSQENTREEQLLDISDHFGIGKSTSVFENAGIMVDGEVYTVKTYPNYVGRYTHIRDIMATGADRQYITPDFIIPDTQVEQWRIAKGSKAIEKTNKAGFTYIYKEGALAFPDSIDGPARTIITSEGGKSPDRCRHAIEDETGTLRRLIPLELERINMFPDNHTLCDGVSDAKRAFLMGNALVCGIVTNVGDELIKRLK